MNMRGLERALPMPTTAKQNGLSNGATSRTPSKPIRPRMRSTSSGSGSPAAHSRVHVNNSYGDDASIDSGIKVDRDKLEQMAHEVVNIKSMLLKLKRVIEEAETINPFDGSLNNSLYTGLAASEAAAAADSTVECTTGGTGLEDRTTGRSTETKQ